MPIDPLHAAYLAQLFGALVSLLREASADHVANDVPDAIAVNLDAHGLTIEYKRAGLTVGEEFV